MKFKNKNQLIEFIKQQLNIDLTFNHRFNNKRYILYTELPRHNRTILSLLHENNIRYEHHLNDRYWIFVK